MGQGESKRAFDSLDLDHTGKLTLDEIAMAGQLGNLDVTGWRSLMTIYEFDEGQEGFLDLKEFQALYDRMKADHNRLYWYRYRLLRGLLKIDYRHILCCKPKRESEYYPLPGHREPHTPLITTKGAAITAVPQPPRPGSRRRPPQTGRDRTHSEPLIVFNPDVVLTYSATQGHLQHGRRAVHSPTTIQTPIPRRGSTPMFSALLSEDQGSKDSIVESLEDAPPEHRPHFRTNAFKKMVSRKLGSDGARKHYMKWLFRIADVEHDDRISLHGLSLVLDAIGRDGIPASNFAWDAAEGKELVERVMEEFDEGGTGDLSKAEFMKLAKVIVNEYRLKESQDEASIRHVGNYSLTRTLGVGSSGVVKLAIQQPSRRKAAIKIALKGNLAVMSRFDTEIRAMQLLGEHPNILRLEEVYDSQTHLFMVTQLCGGGSLHEFQLHSVMSVEEIRYCFAQVVDAVAFMHNEGICHRDLRLENILLSNDGEVKLTDFGHVGFFDQGWDLFTEFCVGSVYHLCPEIINGQTYSGTLVDSWSLGITLYILLARRRPFYAETVADLVELIRKVKFDMPDIIPPQAQDLIRKLIQLDPNARLTVQQIASHPFLVGGPKRKPKLANAEFKVPVEYRSELQTLWTAVLLSLRKSELKVTVRTTRPGDLPRLLKCEHKADGLKFEVSMIEQEKWLVFSFDMLNGECWVFQNRFRRILVSFRALLGANIPGCAQKVWPYANEDVDSDNEEAEAKVPYGNVNLDELSSSGSEDRSSDSK